MTVSEIVAKYLLENGYDGLCCDGCGCSIADLFVCENMNPSCQPAYAHRGQCKTCTGKCDAYEDGLELVCFRADKPEGPREC